MAELVYINRHLSIPDEELRWRFSRSSGPGGQNVNRTSTRVEIVFDVANSPSVDEVQRALLLEKLAAHLDSEGILRVSAQSERSQWRNRQHALARFSSLLREALAERTHRVKTSMPRASRERRLQAKRHAQRLRRLRSVKPDD